MSVETNTEQLGSESILHLLIKFSVPAIIGLVVNAMYNVVDRIFIGNGVGSLGIAAITVSFPVAIIIIAFGVLTATGASSLLSLKLGARRIDEAELVIGQALTLLSVGSLLVTIIGSLYIEPILKLFGASADVMPYAKDYLQIILLGGLIQCLGYVFTHFARAEGRPRIAMFSLLIGAVTNIVLDYVFIFIFAWGIRGAAFATVLGQLVSAIWILSYFLRGNSVLKIRLKYLKPNKPMLIAMVSLGLGAFAMQLAASMLNVFLNKVLKAYGGDIAISSFGVVYSLVYLLLMPVFGISQGVQPIIGYNYGAKRYDRVKEALLLSTIGATIVVTIGFIITRIYPAELIALFNAHDQALIDLGTKALNIFLMFVPVVGFQVIGANYFQAVGKPKQAMLLTLSRQVLLLIPALFILPRFFGLDGIFYAGPISDVLATILTALCLTAEMKQLRYQPTQVFNESDAVA